MKQVKDEIAEIQKEAELERRYRKLKIKRRKRIRCQRKIKYYWGKFFRKINLN